MSKAKSKVITVVGPTGVGKTWEVFERFPHIYNPGYSARGMKRAGFWEPSQNAILIDNFCGGINIAEFLRMLEGGSIYVNTRDGCRRVHFEYIIIASSTQPQEWFQPNGTPKRMAAIQKLFSRIGWGTERLVFASSRDELHAKLDRAFESH